MNDANFRYPDWLDRKQYPFNSHFYTLPIGEMHYVDEWEGDPIVMIHGNPGWSFEYRNVIKELSKNHRCIAPDLLGFGLSDKPYNWDYLPESHAENIEEFLNGLHLDNITLVVNDWGWPIGLSYALKYPHKIKKLVILNTWMWSVKDDMYYQFFSKFMWWPIGRFLIKYFNFFWRVIVKQAWWDATKLTPEIHRQYYKLLSTPKERKWCYTFPKQIIDSSEWLGQLWEKREKINSIPTSIIWWMEDIAFREKELNFWIQNLDNPKVLKLEKVGHFPQDEASEEVVKELQIQ